VSERADQLLLFYREHRIDDQLDFYTRRRNLFDRAAGQAVALSAILWGFASATSALAGTRVGPTWLWSVLATVLPATSTALVAYSTLYAFEQQSKIYGDAVRAGHAASRLTPDPDAPADGRSPEEKIADMVKRVEAVFRQEQAQWGQLTSQIEIPDDTKA
jgi:SMODS and SLOG-associating 2TM effector domain 1